MQTFLMKQTIIIINSIDAFEETYVLVSSMEYKFHQARASSVFELLQQISN